MSTPKVIAGWQVLDGAGPVWSVACAACQTVKAMPRTLLQGPVPPRCKCSVLRAVQPAKAAYVEPERAKPDPANRRNVQRKYSPGEQYGCLTILRDAERTGADRVVIVRCEKCGKCWRIATRNLYRAQDDCVCDRRWRRGNTHEKDGITAAAQMLADKLAKRKIWVLSQVLRRTNAKIAKVEAELQQWRNKRDALMAQGAK
jgi:hypothetical protein